MQRNCLWIFLAAMMLLAPGASRAQSGYGIQSLVKAGDTIAGVKLAPFNETDFGITGLNDNGELVFAALDTNNNRVLFDYNGGKFTRIAGEGDMIGGVTLTALLGGAVGPTINGQTLFFAWDANQNSLMFQYAGGKTTLIAGPGTPVPGGSLPSGVGPPVSMNWQGNVVFGALMTPTVPYPPGARVPTKPSVFLWNAAQQQLTTVAGPGTKLGDSTVLQSLGADPVINNDNEIVFSVESFSPKPPYGYDGLIFMGADGKLQPIVQSGDKLPGGKKATNAYHPVLNDAGVVAFAAAPDGNEAYYLWDKATGSTMGPIIAIGQDAGDGQKVARIEEVSLDPFTASGVIHTRLNDPAFGRHANTRFIAWPGKAGTQGASVASAPARIEGGACDEFIKAYDISYWNAFSPFGDVLFWANLQQKALACIKEGKTEGWIKTVPRLLPSPWDLHSQGPGPTLDQVEALRRALQAQLDAAATAKTAAMMQMAIDGAWQQLGQTMMMNAFGGRGQRRRNASEASAPLGPFFSLATPAIFLTETTSGAEAAYWTGPDGQFKLLLEDGMSTSVGKIRQVYVHPLHFGEGGAWNDYYQVALVADVTSGPVGQDAILLLTPTAAP